MNKKGFTLIELLAVISLLIIIFLLVFPSVKKIISNSEDTINQTQINTILNASYDWSLENLSKLPQESNKIFITLGQLKYDGYIQSDIKNPKTNEQFENDLVISIQNVGAKYKNNNEYAKKNGDYLYKIEYELMNSTNYNERRPKIVLTGTNLIVNSTGNYVTEIDQNNSLSDASYTATSYAGDDLTNKVIINIIYNNTKVDKVDTSKVGIYYINYTVIDSFGYSNTVVRNVIITDTEPPIINYQKSTTIGTEINSYDLMKDVSCTDNSGKCDIKIENSDVLEFGVVGDYIIKYVATDPSGNTTEIKRMITIE